jgi:tetratricopeptide (TPR) repeat protein
MAAALTVGDFLLRRRLIMRRFCSVAITLLILFGAVVAQEKEPQSGVQYYNRGVVRYSKGDYDGAIADFTKAITLNPSFAVAYGDRGLTQLHKGKDAEAKQDIKKAIELDPKMKSKLEDSANRIKQRRSVPPKS